jgi:hypothetical protein
MTRHTEQQQTFVSCGEFLSRASQCCMDAEQALRRQLADVEQPCASGMALVADTEHALAMQLAKYGADGPREIITTRVQYPHELVPPAPVGTPAEALRNVTSINLELTRAVKDLARKTGPVALSDTLNMVADEIDAANRRISNIRVTARDA